jgi:hypothetical protein
MRKAQLLKFIGGIFILVMLLFSMQLQQEISAKDIVKKINNNLHGKTLQAAVSLKVIRPIWNREINIKTWIKEDDYSIILITSSVKEKGTVFLKCIEEVWNWIPTIERYIKLPPSIMSQSFLLSS